MDAETTLRMPYDFIEFPGEQIMSNYDHKINEATAIEIKDKALFSRYAGWHFNGKVWWGGDRWNCDVWQYHSYMETLSTDTLPELMEVVSEKYGWD